MTSVEREFMKWKDFNDKNGAYLYNLVTLKIKCSDSELNQSDPNSKRAESESINSPHARP